MTDIITAPAITRSRIDPLRLPLPKVRLGAAFAAAARAISEAADMVYVAPYTAARHRPPVIGEDGLQGRDPNW